MADQPNVPDSGSNAPTSSTPPAPTPAPTPDPNSFDAKVSQWWANNKLLFFIALPLIIVFFLRDVIFAALAGSARKATQDAQKQDQQLQQTASQAAQDAAKAQAASDAAGQRIADRKDDDIPDDWNKKE